MKRTVGLLVVLTAAALVGVACGSESDGPGSSGASNGGPGFGENDGGEGSGSAEDIELASIRIDPANAVLTVTPGNKVTQAYRLFGKLRGQSAEVDLTSRAVFYVPDNYLVGGFPLDGAPIFTSRLPTAPTDPPQRGGKLTVRATISNSDGPHDATTSLTVKMNAVLTAPGAAGAGVPADAATKFGGSGADDRAPKLYYPNDGTMLPPNLRRLEVQWKGKGGTDLYEIAFKSAVGEVVYYSTCGGGKLEEQAPGGPAPMELEAGACGFRLDEAGYNALAYTNRGAGPVTLRIRGTKADAPQTVGASAEFKIEFAENRVDGGLYYWNVSQTSIMRFDFGAATGFPETFADHGACVGCHALSRDGKKMVASLDGIDNGRLVFTNDVTQVKPNQTNTFTLWDNGPNRLQFASFNPDGTQFVAVYGDDVASGGTAPADMDRTKLFFHDGTTGVRTSSFKLDYKLNHPDWSPDGNMIALTHNNNGDGGSTQQATRGNIELIKKNGASWTAPMVVAPLVTDKNRFNPNFVPDASFLLFTESTCPAGQWDSGDCDSDSDPTAKTYAVKPEVNAALVLLANAQKLGEVDVEAGTQHTGDTFPRSAPFKTDHRGGKLFWLTVASRRRAGLLKTGGPQHLWMFAVDPAKVLAGADGSFTGFYLPFQDLQTSNHIGQWTEQIVGGSQPPPAPPPPPPPPPPAPPGPK